MERKVLFNFYYLSIFPLQNQYKSLYKLLSPNVDGYCNDENGNFGCIVVMLVMVVVVMLIMIMVMMMVVLMIVLLSVWTNDESHA